MEKLTFLKLFLFQTVAPPFFCGRKNSRVFNYFTMTLLRIQHSFVFGKTHVLLTISFTDVAGAFFFGRKYSRFFNYFSNHLVIQFCVSKNSRFLNYFVSRRWVGLFSLFEKTHVFPTILPTTS